MKWLVIIFLYFPFSLFAQVNESDSIAIQASIALSGFYQGGNVQTEILRVKQDFSIQALENIVYKVENSYIYQAFGKEKADEDILSLNFLYFNPEKKFYPFVLAFGSTNFRRDINLRLLVGAGVTYQIIQGEENWLKASISSEYENTEFDNDLFNLTRYNGQEIIDTFRGTLWVKGKHPVKKDKIIFLHESYVQPSLEFSDNFRWQTDLSLNFPLSKTLAISTNYKHTHESLVISGQDKEDRFLTFGFNIKSN